MYAILYIIPKFMFNHKFCNELYTRIIVITVRLLNLYYTSRQLDTQSISFTYRNVHYFDSKYTNLVFSII